MTRGLSSSSHSRGATWRLRPRNAKPVPRVTQHGRVGACCLWRVGTPLELTVCVLHAAQVEAVPCVVKPRCDGEITLSVGAHPCCDVPPAASQRQASAVRHAAQARRRSLSQGRRRSKQAYCCCARRVALVVVYLRTDEQGAVAARGLSPSARSRGATWQVRPSTVKTAPRVKLRIRDRRSRSW